MAIDIFFRFFSSAWMYELNIPALFSLFSDWEIFS